MNESKRNVTIRVDAYTRICLTLIAVLLAVLVIGLWAERPGPAAQAQQAETTKAPPFDSAAQRNTTNELLKDNNAKLGELTALLRSGEAKVQVVQPAGKAEGGPDAESKTGK